MVPSLYGTPCRMSNAQWCQETPWVSTEKSPVSACHKWSQHTGHTQRPVTRPCPKSVELQLQSGSCECQTGQHRVPVSTSLKFVCAGLEMTERWMNLWPRVGEKKNNLVKERANGDNSEKQQVCGYSYLWVFCTLGSHRWLVSKFQQWYRYKSWISVFCKMSFHACVSHSVELDSLQLHGLWSPRPLYPRNSPGKNTGMGVYHVLSCVWLFVTPWTVAPDSSVHGISQAKVLKEVVFSFSRESSQARDQTWDSWITGKFFTRWAATEAHFIHN